MSVSAANNLSAHSGPAAGDSDRSLARSAPEACAACAGTRYVCSACKGNPSTCACPDGAEGPDIEPCEHCSETASGETATQGEAEGWAEHERSPRRHYFLRGVSLCGAYMRLAVEPIQIDHDDAGNCRVCRDKRDDLEAKGLIAREVAR